VLHQRVVDQGHVLGLIRHRLLALGHSEHGAIA
jgi:hypothetical protein